MSNTTVIALVGATGAGKSQLLQAWKDHGQKILVVDGLTHQGPMQLPLPAAIDILAFDHVCFLKNASYLIASAKAWCEKYRKLLVLVDQRYSEIEGLLPAELTGISGMELHGPRGIDGLTLHSDGKSRRVPFADVVSDLVQQMASGNTLKS